MFCLKLLNYSNKLVFIALVDIISSLKKLFTVKYFVES